MASSFSTSVRHSSLSATQLASDGAAENRCCCSRSTSRSLVNSGVGISAHSLRGRRHSRSCYAFGVIEVPMVAASTDCCNGCPPPTPRLRRRVTNHAIRGTRNQLSHSPATESDPTENAKANASGRRRRGGALQLRVCAGAADCGGRGGRGHGGGPRCREVCASLGDRPRRRSRSSGGRPYPVAVCAASTPILAPIA